MHTPGPWRTENGMVLQGETRDTPRGKTTRCICKLQGELLPDYKDNLRLIAAAPELLKALRAFVEPWAIGGKDWQAKITYDTYISGVTAIRKATDELPPEA